MQEVIDKPTTMAIKYLLEVMSDERQSDKDRIEIAKFFISSGIECFKVMQ